jgi:monoamine oxidase
VNTDILIVGGGLAGLALADHLDRAGRAWHLIEAQDRLGGRILTRQIAGASFDLGPAWIWPGQPRILAMIQRFGLTVFEQFATGRLMFQDPSGAVFADRGMSSMQGSYRLAGGLGAVTEALAAQLSSEKIALNTPLSALTLSEDGVIATAAGAEIFAKQVVLAIPPRVLAQSVAFTPALPAQTRATLDAIPTWMAGHAKIIAVYDRPHWREAGFSGDASSQSGPMVEIHDASPHPGGPYGLFGFVGVPPDLRAAHVDEVLDLAKKQLCALFGPAMAQPLEIVLQDWAQDPQIATRQDWIPPRAHPSYGRPKALRGLWSGRLHLGSTEMGQMFGGFVEGALEVAQELAERL